MPDPSRPDFPWPRFSHRGFVLRPNSLRYDPCGDLIFPSIIEAGRFFENPLGRYYLYYAPHNAPGGICLAHADAPEGPWTEHTGNPLVGRRWADHYDVSHVSSPHALWMDAERRMFLYFHGENDTTRFASTHDGLNFTYEGVAVSTAMFERISEASYARVFPCAVPGREAKYVLLFMGNNEGTRRVYAAWSRDGRRFEAQRTPLINPPPGTGVTQVGGPWYWPLGGRNLVVFHGDTTPPDLRGVTSDLYVADVGARFDEENHLGVFYSRDDIGPEATRVSDPCFFGADGRQYLFTAVGPRLQQAIACAVADRPVSTG